MDRPQTNNIGLGSWPQFDNPTFLGWSVVAIYLSAALCCGRAALRADKSVSDQGQMWWVLAGVLVFLGVNKQLNLQTLMILIGRNVAFAGGWYGRRRFFQALFAAVFALLGLGCLAFCAARARRFIAGNRLAFAGVIVLSAFVILRAATINHANEPFGFDLKDQNWAWILEVCGSLLIAFSALKENRRASRSAAALDRLGQNGSKLPHSKTINPSRDSGHV